MNKLERLRALLSRAEEENRKEIEMTRDMEKLVDLGYCPSCEVKSLKEVSYHDLSGTSTYKCRICGTKFDGESGL